MNEEPSDDVQAPRERAFEEHLKSRSTWLRLLFMIVMIVCYAVSRIVVLTVIVLQFLTVLFTGKTNPALTKFGQSLATYTYQIIQYLAFNTELRPFPFDTRWPEGPP